MRPPITSSLGWRGVVSVIAGVVCAGIVMMSIESIGAAVFPLPDSVDRADPEQLRAAMAQGLVPTGALVAVVLAWAAGSVAGGAMGGFVAERDRARVGITVGVVLQIAGVANMITLPHPWWMVVAGVLCFVPGGWLGARLSARLPEPDAAPMPE